MHNIILTGSSGFIGKAFANKIGSDNLYQVEQSHAFDFLNQYDKWDTVDYILHQGAISSNSDTEVYNFEKYNFEFFIALFELELVLSVTV